MEKETIVQELVMLESQFVSSETQINTLSKDLDELKSKVIGN